VEASAPIIGKVCILVAQGGLVHATRSQVGALGSSTLFLEQRLLKSSQLKRLVDVPFDLSGTAIKT